jgi:hypothetical protein
LSILEKSTILIYKIMSTFMLMSRPEEVNQNANNCSAFMLMSRSGVVNQNTKTDTQSIMNATTPEITGDDQNLLETGEPKKDSEVNLENIN